LWGLHTLETPGYSLYTSACTVDISPDFEIPRIIQRIRQPDESGAADLRRLISPGLRLLLARRVGSNDADRMAEALVARIVSAIRAGGLGEPEHLLGFVRSAVNETRRETGEIDEIEQHGPLRDAMAELAPRDRDVLKRFYLERQSEDDIYRETGVELAEIRRIRSRVRWKLAAAATSIQ